MTKWIILSALMILSAYAYKASVFRPARNFHVVDAGRFYRSAQPTAQELEEVVAKYGVRTVINLRGSQPGEWWFDEEQTTLNKLGVKLVNLGFSTENVQNKEDWIQYLETLKNVERPILVHCRSGADRTSEASAIYAIEYMGTDQKHAIRDQMGLQDWHVSLFHPAKKLFVEHYRGVNWLKNYDPCAKEFRSYAKHLCPPLANI